MARIRKAVAYRKLERPYTRKSKYRKHMYVRGTPHSKMVRYVMGNKAKTFTYSVRLVAKDDLQIRHNALEASRMSANRRLEKHLSRQGYFFRCHKYPHHILRENSLASGAGADRLSTGMKRSFGKAISVAAQVRRGDVVFEVGVDKRGLAVAKRAMQVVATKMPGGYYVQEEMVPTGTEVSAVTHVRLPKRE